MSFATDIHPIFVAKCGECHSSGDLGAGYPGHGAADVDAAYEAATADAGGGMKVYDRILIRTALTDESMIMPPFCGMGLDDGDCLTTAEHQLIEDWVAQGAPR